MKKINIIIYLFSFLFFSELFADISNYKDFNKIEMEIFRNDKYIGYNNYFFTKKKNTLEVKNQIKFSVELFDIKILDVEGFGEEKYEKGKLISFTSKTTQNDKKKFVNLFFSKDSNEFIIKGSSYNGKANKNNVIGNWWNHALLKTDSQISPVSGSIKKQKVNFLGEENILLYGKNFETKHFKLVSKDNKTSKNKKLNFDIWLDKNSKIILKVRYSRMGEWEYRLKNIE